eukprot:scaffold570931_cov29-Prasinocladus_malaysianus.AAC.1
MLRRAYGRLYWPHNNLSMFTAAIWRDLAAAPLPGQVDQAMNHLRDLGQITNNHPLAPPSAQQYQPVLHVPDQFSNLLHD